MDFHESVIDLGLAIVRRRGAIERWRRDGYTADVAEADRSSQGELSQAIASVYQAFGYDEAAFDDARAVAEVIRAAARDAA